MKRAKHKLTDVACRNAKPKERAYRLPDGGGLYLLISTTGAKSWQFRYLHGGTEQVASLGRYDMGVTLTEARTAAEDARKRVAKGEHLTVAKRVEKAQRQASNASTFGALKDEWIADEAKRKAWTSDYREEVKASLSNHVLKLNPLPLTEITAAVVDPYLRAVERKAPDMATKVKQRLLGIFDYAVGRGLIAGNPLPRRRRVKVKRKHFPAVTDRKGVGEILRAADKADVSRGVRRAHLLATFTAQRLGVIKNARWSEFDLEAGTWTISRKRMKKKEAARGDHVVTLPPKLLAQMIDWRRADGRDAEYTCPAPRVGGHISDAAVEKFYRVTLGLKDKHSPHSWRTVMKSWAADAGQPDDLAKASLDHGIGNKTDQSYDDAKRVDRRHEFVKWYEDKLIAARDGAEIRSLRA